MVVEESRVGWEKMTFGEELNLTGFSVHHEGLHLGHLYGDLNPLRSNGSKSIVLILDNMLSTPESINQTVGQVLAICEGKAIPVLASSIISAQQACFDIISSLISWRRLNRLSFLKNRDVQLLKMSEVLSPIRQVVDIVSLYPAIVFSNHDNYQFVELANECIKKLNTEDIPILTTRLVSGEEKFLVGFDGKNMSSRNKNALHINIEDETAFKKINSIRTNLQDSSKRLTGNNPVFLYAKLINDPFSEELILSYEEGEVGDGDVKKTFFQKFTAFRDQLNDKTPSELEVEKALAAGERTALERINWMKDQINLRLRYD